MKSEKSNHILKREIKKRLFKVAVFLSFIFTLTYCSYSFTGSSVPSHIKNIYIDSFKDKTHSGEANISETLTNLILENFITDNSLEIANTRNADSELYGSITSISDRSVSITGEEISQRKITVKVKAVYTDNVKKKKVFQKVFSAFAIYDNNADDVTAARSEAIGECLKQIADDILMAVVARW